jgi:hypothetical protein
MEVITIHPTVRFSGDRENSNINFDLEISIYADLVDGPFGKCSTIGVFRIAQLDHHSGEPAAALRVPETAPAFSAHKQKRGQRRKS